ncbi:ABC transporter ATP-binding protein [Microbacterium sp. NPDC091313]
MSTTRVRGEALTRAFGRGGSRRAAIEDVSITAAAGEVVVVRGPSGSGKTTLLTLLAGLDRPDSGRAFIDELEVSAASDAALAALRTGVLGFVPQEFALVPMLSARENVELPLRWAGATPADRDARVGEVLEAVGLAPHTGQRPDRLSGGQQQRVALARALAHAPEVLIADEPTAQLDSATAEAVMDLIVARARRDGVAVVVASHDPDVIARGDRVLTLTGGRVS